MDKKKHSSGMALSPKNMHINVKVSRDENDLLKRVAEKEGRSVSGYVRHIAIQDALSKDKK